MSKKATKSIYSRMVQLLLSRIEYKYNPTRIVNNMSLFSEKLQSHFWESGSCMNCMHPVVGLLRNVIILGNDQQHDKTYLIAASQNYIVGTQFLYMFSKTFYFVYYDLPISERTQDLTLHSGQTTDAFTTSDAPPQTPSQPLYPPCSQPLYPHDSL